MEIPKLELGLRTRVKTKLIPVEFILSIMEIEAWFLAEVTHFPKIDPGITVAGIRAQLGFDPEIDNMEDRDQPNVDLNHCYQIGGKSYLKCNAKTTVNSLDYALIYMGLRHKFAYLGKLITNIDNFFT